MRVLLELIDIELKNTMVWRCSICAVFTTFSLKLLLSHINRQHSRSPDFWLLCGIDGCTEDYRVYNSYYHHIKRRHPQYLRDGIQPTDEGTGGQMAEGRDAGAQTSGENSSSLPLLQTTTEDFVQPVSPPAEQDNIDQPFQTPDSNEEEPDTEQDGTIPTAENLRRHATLFVINTRAKSNISQKSVNTIVAGVQQYQSSLMDHLKKQMEDVLKKHSGNASSSQLEKDALDVFDRFVDPFAEVATTFRQDSIMKKQFDSLEAEEIPAGQILEKKGAGYTIKSKVFYYVPLVESLEQFLSHPRIWSIVEVGPKKCNEGFVYDIIDGELLKSHPVFSTKPDALQIILYTDEIEICNPLGSCASKNKLLMVYYTLGNINPKYRSKLAAIRLLAMAKSADLRQPGVDPLLNRIKEDLDKLHNGVEIHTANGKKTVYGAMVSLCGDTLAQHEMAGFKEGVGFAFSKCRHCECSFQDMQSQFCEDAFTKRSLERHVRQCDEIEKAQTDLLRNSLKTTYGINRRSKLVEFPYFDIIQQTPQDIMHVILEGIAPLEVKCVLNNLIQSGQVDLDSVNSGILGFPYSPLDVRDRPTPISVNTLMSNDNKLKQSSGQMLVMLRILPFILPSLDVTEEGQLILELIDIAQIAFAPLLSIATISKLKVLIENHLKRWKELFPDRNVTPKQHYMIHLPSQIRSLGPMVRHMCMRFESKHVFFKQKATKQNFKNICKSLINQNQIYESCQNVDPSVHPVFSNDRELGPVSEVGNVQILTEKLRVSLGLSDVQHAVSVKWIVINSNKYIKQKSLVLAKVHNRTIPQFGQIKNIFVVNSTCVCFEYQICRTVCFDRQHMCYQVEVPHMDQDTEVVEVDKLVDHMPYYILNNGNQTYVLIKYNLTDVMELYCN